MTNYLENIYRLKIVQKSDIVSLVGNENAAKELLRRFKKQGLLAQIKRDMYVANDLATKTAIASKFEIGSQINSTAFLSHHAALEYHGLANQVFYEMQISSKQKFKQFDFEGITYLFHLSKTDVGVVAPPYDSFVRVTNLERTVVDCINRIDLCGGLEELIVSFALLTIINEQKILDYLDAFDKQALYQKAGFILSYFQDTMKLSDSFFAYCQTKIGKSTRYLTDSQESNVYFKEWRLVAPKNILSYLEQGGGEYV
ncbi:MAG: hypothetical protein LBV75_08695 [Paludibacter sp.]|jgi:predicted transcriptional regulator of viral defense system|nr:hypothetical protein [Paludibacter sp.]